MATYAVIENGVVVNKCVAEVDDVKPANWVLCEESADIGWSYKDNQFTKSEAQIPVEDQARNVRSERDLLLRRSDWTQVADAPVDQAAWAAYRQALRDVPSQAGFPWDVQWPTQPE